MQIAGTLRQPRRIKLERRGVTTLDLRVADIAFGPGATTDTDFAIPAGFVETPVVKTGVRKVAERLYEIGGIGGGLYRTQFIDADEGVIVFDAPLGYAVGQQIIRLIQETLPGKSIATVVISHFHSDHAAGVQAFVDSGAEVVAAAPIRPVLERYGRAASALAPSRPAPPRPFRFRPVEASPLRVGTAGGAAIDAHQITTPHARDMVFLVDSLSRTLIQGDLYSELSPFNDTFKTLTDWLVKNGQSIQRVLGTHHEEAAPSILIGFSAPYSKLGRR